MEYRIQIKGRDGSLRDVESAEGLQPGEVAIMEPIVEHKETATSIEDGDLLLRMAAFFGVHVSDFIEASAKAFNIPPCASCQLTKRVLYSIKQLGVLKSTVFLMKTFAARFGAVESERIKAELETALTEGGTR